MARVYHTKETRQRIISAYENGDDWVPLVDLLGIKVRTAKSWIRRSQLDASRFSHGGARIKKLGNVELNEISDWITENPTITLRSIQSRLRVEYNKDVCLSTIGNHLDGALITLKKTHPICETMNSDMNKERRKK